VNDQKPHFRIIAGRPVSAIKAETKVDLARKRHGKPFAHEAGATWRPNETPLLTRWMQTRGKGQA